MLAYVPASRLLLVEDDEDTREILGTVLREEGYQVTLTASPQEAIQLLEEQVFHFVLTDLFAGTPEEPLRSIASLRAQAQPTPLGVMTGWNISSEAAQRAGVACFIKKPFELDDLLTTIAACLHVRLSPEQQRQAEVVERFFAVLNAREWETLMGLCAAQLSYYPAPGSLYAAQRRLIGRNTYLAYVQDVFDQLSLTRFEHLVISARPKGLAARYTYGVTLPDGRQQQRAGATLFHFRAGQIAQIGVKVRHKHTRQWLAQQQLALPGKQML